MYLDDDRMPRCDGGDALLGRLFGPTDSSYDEKNCACGSSGCGVGEFDTTWGIKGNPKAMVYSVLQDFDGLYDKDKALLRGTLFEGLDLPFLGSSSGTGAPGCSCGICGGARDD